MQVLRQKLQNNFSRAANDYDVRAEFQHVQTRRVLDAALMLFPQAACIADIGCGTGYFAAAAAARRPDWKVIGIDIAMGMSRIAATRCQAINADAVRLPLADASVDAAVSSLCYQWIEDQTHAFTELARIMKPGARAIIASLGETTLRELRECAATADLSLGLLPMRNFEQCRETLMASGLQLSYAQQHLATEYYDSVAALLDSMRTIGAGNNFAREQNGFIAPKRFAAMTKQYEQLRTDRGIPATWEHHFFVLHKPQ